MSGQYPQNKSLLKRCWHIRSRENIVDIKKKHNMYLNYLRHNKSSFVLCL